MKKVLPYKTARNALSALDNGGRFYNVFTKAKDGQIATAELSKAAGVFSDKQIMMLFFEMSLIELKGHSQINIVNTLSQNLKTAYEQFKPLQFSPGEARKKGKLASSAIITGVPIQIDSRTEFTGFIMVPIQAGKVTTFSMIPIFEQYEVYEFRDENTSKDFIIAHTKGAAKLPKQTVRCGGVLKELKKDQKKTDSGNMFLETLYYTPL